MARRGGRRRHVHRARREPRRDSPRRHARHRRGRQRRSSRARAAYERTSDAGPQDVVVLTVKAHQVGAIAADLAASLSRRDGDRHDAERHSVVVLPQARRRSTRARRCGPPIPTARSRASIDAGSHHRLGRVSGGDARGARRRARRRRQAVHARRARWLDDGARRRRFRRRSRRAGFKAPVIDDIRSEIWLKLWGNLSFNPISALTHATLVGSAAVSAHARAERRR